MKPNGVPPRYPTPSPARSARYLHSEFHQLARMNLRNAARIADSMGEMTSHRNYMMALAALDDALASFDQPEEE